MNIHAWNLLVGLKFAIFIVRQLAKNAFSVIHVPSECDDADDDDDGNNYLIAATNVRVELTFVSNRVASLHCICMQTQTNVSGKR